MEPLIQKKMEEPKKMLDLYNAHLHHQFLHDLPNSYKMTIPMAFIRSKTFVKQNFSYWRLKLTHYSSANITHRFVLSFLDIWKSNFLSSLCGLVSAILVRIWSKTFWRFEENLCGLVSAIFSKNQWIANNSEIESSNFQSKLPFYVEVAFTLRVPSRWNFTQSQPETSRPFGCQIIQF